MSFTHGISVEADVTRPISSITVNKKTVTFLNESGRQKVTFLSTSERIQFVKLLLS